MKKATLFVIMMLVTVSGFCQFNYKFNYQAVVRDASGALVPNGNNVSFRLSILENSATGTVLYSETQTALVNNSQGLVNLVIGDGTPITGFILFSGNFQDLTKTKFLKVEIDPAGGTSYIDMGATQLQFVPYAAHAFTATLAENGTQWGNGAASSINYTAGNVNIGASVPAGTSILNVEQATNTDHVVSVTQTGATGGLQKAAIYGKNSATGTTGIGVSGAQMGSGWGVYGFTNGDGRGVYGFGNGTNSVGVFGRGAVGMTAVSTATNGAAINLDGYIKVSGTRTAYQTPALVSGAASITLSYSGATSSDMVFVSPVTTSSSAIMPSWVLIWTSPNWIIYNASDDGVPANFPAGTAFNILVIKQ